MAKKYGIQIKGLGRALRPSGLGVLRPKPTGKGGKPLKPKPVGKKDGGKVRRFGSEDGVITSYEEKRGRAIAKATGNEYKKGGKVSKEVKARNKASKKMFKKFGGKK